MSFRSGLAEFAMWATLAGLAIVMVGLVVWVAMT